MLTDKVLETIARNDLIHEGEHIAVGLSGGPDSICLFHVLMSLRERLGITVSCVHVNHMFRGEAADADMRFVEKLCEENGVRCDTYTYDCPGIAEMLGMTSEEAGRQARYEAFGRAAAALSESFRIGETGEASANRGAAEYPANCGAAEVPAGGSARRIKIALAHNLNDQAETVLFRVLRGSGTDGLAGMEYSHTAELKKLLSEPFGTGAVCGSGTLGARGACGTAGCAEASAERPVLPETLEIIRPLLDAGRSEIEAYCAENGLASREDATNSQEVYTRNKIRLGLLKKIEDEYNPNVIDTLARLAKNAREDSEALWLLTEAAATDSCDELMKLHPAIRHRVYLKMCADAGLSADVTRAHIEAIDVIAASGRASARADLPRGFFARVSYGKLSVGRCGEGINNADGAHALSVRVADINDYSREFAGAAAKHAAFDADAFFGNGGRPAVAARTRRPGDFIALRGGGNKKLQDVFTDDKVPRDLRDSVIVAASGSEVLWIPADPARGVKDRKSGKYAVSGTTRNVLIIEFTDKM